MNRVIPNRRREREELKKAKHDIAKLHLMLEQAERELELARVDLSKVEEPDIAPMQRGYQFVWSGICILCPIVGLVGPSYIPIVQMVLSTVLFINVWVAHAKRGAEQICFYRAIAVMRIPILLNVGFWFYMVAWVVSTKLLQEDGESSNAPNDGFGTSSLWSTMMRQMVGLGGNDENDPHLQLMKKQLVKFGGGSEMEALDDMRKIMKSIVNNFRTYAPMVLWSLFIIWVCLEMFVFVQWCSISFFHDDHTQDENPDPEVELAGHADVDPQDIDNPPQPPVDVALNVQPEDAPAPIKAAPDQENDDAPAADVDPEQV